MRKKTITVNGVQVTAYEDGSVERMVYGELRRDFGCTNSEGYKLMRLGGKITRVHRVVAQAFLPDFREDLEVDHKDGNKIDNRPSELRMRTRKGNSRGHQNARVGVSSKYRGVSWFKGRGCWQGFIRVNRKQKWLGYFTEEIEAAEAYNKAAIKCGYSKEALNIIPTTF